MPFKQDWFGKVVLVENNYQWQLADSTVLVKLWKENGIHMTFKRLALSRYYLNPTHCEFGDFDCYLSGKFEDGNRVASDADYKVDTGWYKHFHIRFSRRVENHNYFIQYRKGKKERELNKTLIVELCVGTCYLLEGQSPYCRHWLSKAY